MNKINILISKINIYIESFMKNKNKINKKFVGKMLNKNLER